MALISIIVPVYNVEKYLPRCLDSLRSQVFKDIEIICVEDGSTDSSPQLLKIAADLDPRIVVAEQKNQGVSAARNHGLELASGEIVMFVDSDDFLKPGACATVAREFGEKQPDILTFGGEAISFEQPHQWLANALKPKDAVVEGFDEKLFKKCLARPYIWLSAFSRDFIERSSLRFDEELAIGEDQLFYLDAYPKSQRTVSIKDDLYSYRYSRPGSAMHIQMQKQANVVKNHLAMADKVFTHWHESGIFEDHKAGLLKWFLQLITYDAFHAKDSAKAIADMQDLIERHFGPIDDLEVDAETRLILQSLEQPKNPLNKVRSLAVLGLRGMDDPVNDAKAALEKFSKLFPVKAAKAVAKRILPATSLTQYKRINRAYSVTTNMIDDAQAYNRLISEWEIKQSEK